MTPLCVLDGGAALSYRPVEANWDGRVRRERQLLWLDRPGLPVRLPECPVAVVRRGQPITGSSSRSALST